VEGLLSSAESRTGLSDWGDGRFHEALQALVSSFESDVELHPAGRWFFMRKVVLEKLVNRLLIQRDLQRFPEILDMPIERPIFITGLPRTGTTLLQRMLAQVPTVRTLQLWELMRPSPPPEHATYATDPRRRPSILSTMARIAIGERKRRELSSIHYSAASEPEECTHLLMNTFATTHFAMYGPARGYLEWLGRHDAARPYEHYRRQLQLLTWRCSRERLVLKAPIHLRNLRELRQTFPDSHVIWTHREMSAVAASNCSMLARFRGLFSDKVSPIEIGREVLANAAANLDAAESYRDRDPSIHILDVQYDDLVGDPLGTLEKIADMVDLRLSAGCRKRVRTHLASSERGRHGPHLYDLATYGIRAEEVARLFGGYHARFGLGR
jgi:hypothetical protein